MNEPKSRRTFLRACPAAALLALGWNLAGCDSGAMEDEDPPPSGSGIVIDGDVITIDLTSSQGIPLSQAGGFLFITAAKTVALNVGGKIRAFTTVCTHQGCDINGFRSSVLVCFCHGSEFDTSGEVVTGPASASLTEYAVARSGDSVTITKG